MKLLLSKEEAAEILGQDTKTLDNWRYNGTGPAYVKLPKKVMYSPAALEAFIATCTVQPILTQLA